MTRLIDVLRGGEWRAFWQSLQVPVVRFTDVGLVETETDARIWEVCQAEQLVLVTANRNEQGPDSLEATIRLKNSEQCLPVLTLVNPKRVIANSAYAERVALRMLEYLLDIDQLRGTGRLFLP